MTGAVDSRIDLRMTGKQFELLRVHLYPGDGLEAGCFAVCGRAGTPEHEILSVHRLLPVPHAACRRGVGLLQWPTDLVAAARPEMVRNDQALLKIHSHPGGYARFSEQDDLADADLFASVCGWFDGDRPHASAIMLPDGTIFGRAFGPRPGGIPIDRVVVAGERIHVWHRNPPADVEAAPEANRLDQAFGSGTRAALRRLTIGVIGCSGTGSFVVEELTRLGIGRLILIDPDRMDQVNLDRILNSSVADAISAAPKVDVMAAAVLRTGLPTAVETYAEPVESQDVVHRLSRCDLLFSCVDSLEAREVLNRIAACYLGPLIDLGVRIEPGPDGGVSQACGEVRYLQPDGSSLLSRGVFTSTQLAAAWKRKQDPSAYEELVRTGYLPGLPNERPAVVALNGFIASLAVLELLARIHPIRDLGNEAWATTTVSISQGRLFGSPDGPPSEMLTKLVGVGDIRPPLGLPALS